MVINDWQRTSLGDETELLTGFPFKSALYSANEGDIRLVRGDNVVQGQFRWEDVKKWPASQVDDLSDYFLKSGDVVVAMDRPWIEAGLKYACVSDHDLPCLLVQRVARLRTRETLDQGFLRYIIGSAEFTNHVLGIQTGTAVPHISSRQIQEFRFSRPPLSEQRAIAHILGTLDDKIELNRRMNETLEALARAIFKAWFVDFDPVRAKMEGRQPAGIDAETAALFPAKFEDSALGQTPKGWKVGPLSEIATVSMGASPSGDTYNDVGNGIPLINGPVEFGGYFAVKSKWTTSPTRLSEAGDLIFCVRGSTTGRRVIADDVYCLGRGVCAIQSRHDCQPFIYQVINFGLERLLARTSGSVFPNLSGADISQFEILIPSQELMRKYCLLTEPLTKKIWQNVKESDTLATLRNMLLPKLLSGEIRMNLITQ